MALKPTYDSEIAFQSDRRKAAVELIKIISDLWYDFSIELVLFRNQLMDRNVSEILKLHEYAGEFVNKPISIFDSVEMAQAIKLLNLPASKLDIGKLFGGIVGESESRLRQTIEVAEALSPCILWIDEIDKADIEF